MDIDEILTNDSSSCINHTTCDSDKKLETSVFFLVLMFSKRNEKKNIENSDAFIWEIKYVRKLSTFAHFHIYLEQKNWIQLSNINIGYDDCINSTNCSIKIV